MNRAELSNRAIEFEKDVKDFLSQLGFHYVEGGSDFRIAGFQIDAIGRFENVGVVIECKTAYGPRKLDFREEIVNFRGKINSIRKDIRGVHGYEDCEDFKFVLVTNQIADENAQKLAHEEPVIYLWNKAFIDFYRDLRKKLGEFAINNLAAELDIKPRIPEVISIPCFKIQLYDYSLYLFFIEPKRILKFSFIARREVTREAYYQRMVKPERLRKIAYYLTKEEKALFPNNIILAFSKDVTPSFKSVREARESIGIWPQWLDFGVLTFPQSYRACWVVDGQHRLLSFTNIEQTDLKIPVVALDNLSAEEQANFFLTINSKQKPVPPDLVWDLQSELRPESEEGIISQVVKELNKLEPFRQRIYIPSLGLKQPGQLRMAGICNTIKRKGLIKGRTENMKQKQLNPLYHDDKQRRAKQVAEAISNYFRYLVDKASEPFKSKFVLSNAGVSVFLNLYERLLSYLDKVPSDVDLDSLLNTLMQQLNSTYSSDVEVHRLKLRCNSEGGRDEVTDEFVTMINEASNANLPLSQELSRGLQSRLGELEKNLRELINKVLSKSDPNWLRTHTPPQLYNEVMKRAKGSEKPVDFLTLGDCFEIIQHGRNWEKFSKIFLHSIYGFNDQTAFYAAIKQLLEPRNAIVHRRPLKLKFQDRQIIELYLDKLERLISEAMRKDP